MKRPNPAIALFTSVAALSLLAGKLSGETTRKVSVVVYLDEEFQKKLVGHRWDRRIRSLFARASREFRSKAGVQFVPADVIAWESPDTLLTPVALLRQLAGSPGDRPSADIVVGLTGQEGLRDGEVVDYLAGRVLVRTTGDEKEQAFWLARGLARLMGAVPLEESGTLMAKAPGTRWNLKLDPANLEVVKLHQNRRFGKDAPPLPPDPLNSILSVYADLIEEGRAPSADIHIMEGLLLHARGDGEAAGAALVNGFTRSPEAANSILGLESLIQDSGHADATSSLLQGWLRWTKGEPREALAWFQRSLEAQPDLADAHYAVAVCLGDLGSWAEAIPHLEQVVRERRDLFPAWLALARAYLNVEDFRGAQAAAWEATRQSPLNVDAHVVLGTAYLERERFREALAEGQKALDLEPGNGPAHLVLARAHIFLGRPQQAAEEAEEAARRMPGSPDAFYILGNTQMNIEQFGRAAEAYETAIQLDPNHARAHSNLALIYFNRGDLERARHHAETARDLGFEKAELILQSLSGR